MSRRSEVRRKKSNKMSIFLIGFVIMLLCGIMVIQMSEMKVRQHELKAQESDLKSQLAKEQQRTADLHEEKVYVQTKKYVEEKAKELGYVYPDEIIFKPEKK